MPTKTDSAAGDDPLAVMSVETQDPLLYKIYENLPHLECIIVVLSTLLHSSFFFVLFTCSQFCDIEPFSKYSNAESPCICFSVLYNVLSDSSIEYVFRFFLY